MYKRQHSTYFTPQSRARDHNNFYHISTLSHFLSRTPLYNHATQRTTHPCLQRHASSVAKSMSSLNMAPVVDLFSLLLLPRLLLRLIRCSDAPVRCGIIRPLSCGSASMNPQQLSPARSKERPGVSDDDGENIVYYIIQLHGVCNFLGDCDDE